MQKETIENYCKVISQLSEQEGARSIDVANTLNISKISVSITLHKLKEEGYIHMQP
jgi:Mn-dependent DtxR family transcriptional regulator